MQALRGFTWLLLMQLAGEALSRALALPFPGPVVGMLLLMAALGSRAVRADVAGVARFLLAHLSLLFVPVGVGVVTHLDVLRHYGLQLAVVLALSTWACLAVTALMLARLMRGHADEASDAGGDAGATPAPPLPGGARDA